MDYVITFSDVMAGIMTVGIGLIGCFVKKWFTDMEKANKETQKQIDDGNKEISEQIRENDKKVNERIDKLEEKTAKDIDALKKELGSIEKDFPLMYVHRDDFIRVMNNVEGNIKEVSEKIDRLMYCPDKS